MAEPAALQEDEHLQHLPGAGSALQRCAHGGAAATRLRQRLVQHRQPVLEWLALLGHAQVSRSWRQRHQTQPLPPPVWRLAMLFAELSMQHLHSVRGAAAQELCALCQAHAAWTAASAPALASEVLQLRAQQRQPALPMQWAALESVVRRQMAGARMWTRLR